MNHRRVQRTLFRMLFDEDFAARVHRGDADALVGLAAEEAALLRAADPIGVSADRDGRRKTQALGNLLKEFLLSASAADAAGLRLGAGFFASDRFHAAIREDRRLPLAFADHVAEQARNWGRPEIEALVALESGMVRARRAPRHRSAPRPGEVVLGPEVSVLEVPRGTVDHAAAWRRHLAGGERPRFVAPPAKAVETLLLRRRAVRSHYATPELAVEVLEPNVAALFARANRPLDEDARRAHAAGLGASFEDLEAFLDGFVAEGLLRRG